jgi:hypothetical protein
MIECTNRNGVPGANTPIPASPSAAAAVHPEGQVIFESRFALDDAIYLAQRFPEPVWHEPSMTDRACHGKGARSGSAQPVRAAGEASVRAV